MNLTDDSSHARTQSGVRLDVGDGDAEDPAHRFLGRHIKAPRSLVTPSGYI